MACKRWLSRVSLPKRDERLLDILIRESDRLNKFEEDFLLFARPGKHTKSSVDLVQFLRDSVTLFQNSPEVRDKHDVRLELEEAQRIQVWGNADQLKQVFWNLTQNAVRAMPTGGTLTISARELSEGGSQITFEDIGVGMSPEEKRQLFQPFQSGFGGGTGLGLSIVKKLVLAMHGELACESTPGNGATFAFRLPRAGSHH